MPRKKTTTKKSAGQRRERAPQGIPKKRAGFLLPVQSIDWLEKHSSMANISKSAYLGMLLRTIEDAENGIHKTGMLDAYTNRMEDMVETAARKLRKGD